jgi:transcriptional regulator with XRE-family HTH domain
VSLLARLEARRPEILRQLQEPNLEGLRAFVCLLDDCFLELGGDPFLRSSALQRCFPALAWFRQGKLQAVADWISHEWAVEAVEPGPQGLEFLAAYNVAVSELLATRLQDAQARLILRRLMAYLGLSLDHLARMLSVAGDTVRLWERGHGELPASRLGELLLADKALDRLLTLFRPERLPQIIRRKADLFEGEEALDWILRGRIADVADRYDAALSYQG